ncbi:MAG TPA: hypothetical protein VF662_13220 [Allosphingosinicella sp.]|jgi:hypothetical protein
MLIAATIATPAAVLLMPAYFLPLSLFLFLLLNFGGHAALHRSLVPIRGSGHALLAEMVSLFAYASQLLNYQLITAAHINHHAVGRNEPLTVDIVAEPPGPAAVAAYYFRLICVPHAYWFGRGFWDSALEPMARRSSSGRVRLLYRLPKIAAQLFVLAFTLAGLCLNPVHFLLYFVGIGFLFNVLQNVAHYGLTGVDRRTHAYAAYTYVVGPLARRITYGSLAHLPHHVFMKRSGLVLHHDTVIESVERRLGFGFRVKYGLRAYLADVIRQFRGPVERARLSEDWMAR